MKKKLILVHSDEDHTITSNFAHKYKYHIIDPHLVYVGFMYMNEGDNIPNAAICEMFDDITTMQIRKRDDETILFITDAKQLTTAVVELSKVFDVFNIVMHQPYPVGRSVIVSDASDVDYAFTQVVQWVF